MSEGSNADDFSGDVRLTPAAIEELDRFFQSVSPKELREHLLEIYHTYLVHAHDSLPADFEKLSMNMYLFIGCLGILENEIKK